MNFKLSTIASIIISLSVFSHIYPILMQDQTLQVLLLKKEEDVLFYVTIKIT